MDYNEKIKLTEIEELKLCGDINMELGDEDKGKIGDILC